jgi:excisionase family DNA binding protein
MTQEATPALLTAPQVAKLLQVSVRHVRRLAQMDKMPKPIRLGQALRWRKTEIQEWLDAGAPECALVEGASDG